MVTKTDGAKNSEAVLACTSWISANRPHITGKMLLHSTYGVAVKDNKHYVSIAVEGPSGYEYFCLLGDPGNPQRGARERAQITQRRTPCHFQLCTESLRGGSPRSWSSCAGTL